MRVTSLLPDAVLWDMDGTIVNTEPYWMAAEHQLVADFGVTWNHEDSLEIVGASLDHAARVFQARGVKLDEGQIIERLSSYVVDQLRESVPWRPGARELLQELREAGIRTALVTMSYRAMAELVSDSIGFDAFDQVVTGDLVTHGKPHPEPYLHAARALGVDVTNCVAIEDSPTGLASAIASGAVTIGVPAHVELPESTSYTHWSTLANRSVADLTAVYTANRFSEKTDAL